MHYIIMMHKTMAASDGRALRKMDEVSIVLCLPVSVVILPVIYPFGLRFAEKISLDNFSRSNILLLHILDVSSFHVKLLSEL